MTTEFAEESQRIEQLVEEIIAGEHKIDKLPNSSAGFTGAAQAEYFSKARYHLESDVSNLIVNHKQQLDELTIVKDDKGARMIEHNLFEMENYRELIDEVGVDKFRERFEELQKTAMEFIEMAGFSETAYCNERILMQVILDYLMDVMRFKGIHSIERIRTEKLFASRFPGSFRRKTNPVSGLFPKKREIILSMNVLLHICSSMNV